MCKIINVRYRKNNFTKMAISQFLENKSVCHISVAFESQRGLVKISEVKVTEITSNIFVTTSILHVSAFFTPLRMAFTLAEHLLKTIF